MSNELAERSSAAEVLEQVIIKGDLGQLQPVERVQYYNEVCRSVGLNPFTKPFEYIKLNGKLTLYALKGATDQLRSMHGVSIEAPKVDYVDDLIIVSVVARDKTGRTDADTGAVTIANLKGEAKANAIMKAITKAKRRVTLSMCGLGMLDETEVETIPDAKAWVEPVKATVEVEEPVGVGDEKGRKLLKHLASLGILVENQFKIIDRVTEKTRGVTGIEPANLTEDEMKRIVGLAKRDAEKAKEAAGEPWERWENDKDAIAFGSNSGVFDSGQAVMTAWEETKSKTRNLENLYPLWYSDVQERIREDRQSTSN